VFRRRRTRVTPEGPVVYDRSGLPVGVRSSASPPADEPAPAKHVRRLEALRRTRELEGQYAVRCTVSLFCSDPPRGAGYR
jgi:hypothetical protein